MAVRLPRMTGAGLHLDTRDGCLFGRDVVNQPEKFRS